MTELRKIMKGMIVGTGSDFVVVLKGKKRFLIQFESFKIIELQSATTPYGSDY
jgi:hypothetical protein